MTAAASVSSPWIPEDDLLLKNSIEGGASLEALAKGAVKFSRRFTFRELRDRWYSLLYDPDVSAQASARMAELEQSGSNPSSKLRLDNLKGSEKVSEKRKTGSIRRQYYAMQKRKKNEIFSSPNLGFFEERNLHSYSQQEHKFQGHVTTNHNAHCGDATLDDCLANNLGFEEKDFEILRQAFPESIGSIVVTTTVVDNPANAFHMEECHKPVDCDFINGSTGEGGLYKFTEGVSPTRNELMVSYDPNIEMKNATCMPKGGSGKFAIGMGNEKAGPSETPANEKLFKTDKPEAKLVLTYDSVNENENNQVLCSVFGGKQHFSSPVSDGSASFHTMGFSSPSTRLPLWKTLEDVSAPDMPVDENNAESHQVAEETLVLPEDCDHRRESKNSPGYDATHPVPLLRGRPNGFTNSSAIQEGEYTDISDSLLNFSNEDDILFMDVDVKDTMHDISDPQLLGSPTDAQEVDLDNAEGTTSLVASPNLAISSVQCLEESRDSSFHSDQHDVCHQAVDLPSTSVSQSDSLELTQGKIICTLNTEDPEIPCNDDIFLLIHPSTPFAPSVGLQIATDSLGPLSSSSHEKDDEQGQSTVRKGKDPAPCFTRSHTLGANALPEFVSAHPLVGPAFKRESPDGEYLVPLPGKSNNLRISSQTRPMHASLEIAENGVLGEDANKIEHQGLDRPSMYNDMPLPVEACSVKMIEPETMDDSYISDQNNSDSDDDIPYFSDVEAMILEMDLAHSQESCMASEVARYQYEGTKRMIIRLEQAARSSFQRAMTSRGALAIFYGRRLKHYIKKAEVTIGRSTDDTEVDIDLKKEGRANKISRRQAIIKMETDGSFNLKNLGASSISLNGKEVAHGQVVALGSSCLIEIRGMSFVFEINDKCVKRFLANQRC